MTVIYFPFTAPYPSTMRCLSACFLKAAVYRISDTGLPQHLKPWVKSGFLDIRVPVSGEEQKIASVLRDYKNWALLHENTPSAFLKHQQELPFYSDTSISKIRTDIAKRTREKKDDSPASDFNPAERCFTARLFLALAEEYDVNQLHIIDDFQVVDTIEKKLFRDLKGEPDEPDFLPSHQPLDTAIEDPGLHMTEERIKAWAMLMFQDHQEKGIYATDSRAVFDFLGEQDGYNKTSFTLTGIPVLQGEDGAAKSFKEKLTPFLEHLSENPDLPSVPDAPPVPQKLPDEASLTLSVNVIAGVVPHEYFGRYLPPSMTAPKHKGNNRIKHTLICLLEQH